MIEDGQIDWDEVKKRAKILRIKTRRGIHKINKKYKISESFRKVCLIVALKVVAMLSSGSQALAQEITPQRDKEQNKTELLAYADTKSMDMTTLWQRLDEYIASREKEFAVGLSQDLTNNVYEVAQGKKRGRKSATLKRLFGTVNPRFYCAISGLKTIEELAKRENFFEYDFLLKCIKNPHSCLSVLSGLSERYGDEGRTSNIRKTLREQQERNKNSVFIVLADSKANTSSGKHFVIVTPEFAADSVVVADKNEKLQVFSFNSEVIEDIDKYFVGTRNRGNVYNLTDLGRENLIDLFYRGQLRITEDVQEKEHLVHFEPVSNEGKEKMMENVRKKQRRTR